MKNILNTYLFTVPVWQANISQKEAHTLVL